MDEADEEENLERVSLKKLKSQLGEQIKQLSEIRLHNETEKSLVKEEDDALKPESVRAVEKSLTLSGDEEYLQLKIQQVDDKLKGLEAEYA